MKTLALALLAVAFADWIIRRPSFIPSAEPDLPDCAGFEVYEVRGRRV